MTPFIALVTFLAADAPPQQGPMGILSNPMVMIPLMLVMMYFMIIRPGRMQRKEMEARVASLQAGDRVVTSSGIHGIVHVVRERTVVVKVAEATMIEFDKPAIAAVQKKEAK